jgi:hypothetical protein
MGTIAPAGWINLEPTNACNDNHKIIQLVLCKKRFFIGENQVASQVCFMASFC